MINRAGNKEKAKRVLNENGNLSGMVGMEILYRVIAAITSVLLGAMIAGGIGVVSAVVSAPFKLFGLAGIIIAYVLITPIATLVGAIAGGAVAGPFEVARYRYYLSLRKNGIRPKVTCIFDAFDFFMQFALVTGVRMLTIMWIPVLIQFATLLLAAVVAAASRSYLAAMLLVMIGMIAALVVAAYRSYQFWPMALVQADHPQLNAEQVMERCKVMTEGHKFDLFVFDLSYLGWNILSLLTGGILSVLYVAPYKMMATAFVYGEPNNSSNVVADESCVAVWPVKWNDLANSNTYEQSGYICEWEASDAAEETQVEGYTGHLYEFYTLPESEWESGPITWQQAEKRCEWKGGHLAVIESSTENFLLYSAMKAKGYENAYFGFSDESSEGNWKWVNGTSTSYTNWHSGEPSNQDGIEHYAMFYEKFQDGTWNDADGIIDAGCAYICEWDDPTDKISQGDSFTDQQLRIIAKDLGVPDDLNVEIRQSPKAYWEAAGLWDIYVEITHNGKLVASGSFDVETGEMGRNIYIYTPV